MGLLENMQYPEVKALYRSILSYMAGPEFSPAQELRPEELCVLVRSERI
jgi:hypothetical protein